MQGDTYTGQIIDRIPLRVAGFSLFAILKLRVSVLTFHWTPRALSVSTAFWSKLRSFTDGDLSASGTELSTFFKLDIHLVRRKPPLESSSRS